MIPEFFVHWIVLLGVAVSAFAAIEFKDLVSSSLSLGVMGLLLSLEFYLLQAPDVAITEASVGAALTAIIFLVAISKTRRFE